MDRKKIKSKRSLKADLLDKEVKLGVKGDKLHLAQESAENQEISVSLIAGGGTSAQAESRSNQNWGTYKHVKKQRTMTLATNKFCSRTEHTLLR